MRGGLFNLSTLLQTRHTPQVWNCGGTVAKRTCFDWDKNPNERHRHVRSISKCSFVHWPLRNEQQNMKRNDVNVAALERTWKIEFVEKRVNE